MLLVIDLAWLWPTYVFTNSVITCEWALIVCPRILLSVSWPKIAFAARTPGANGLKLSSTFLAFNVVVVVEGEGMVVGVREVGDEGDAFGICGKGGAPLMTLARASEIKATRVDALRE